MTVLGQKAGLPAAILLVLISLPGCSRGTGKPEGLPALTPCTVTVLYKGSPVSEATVTLVPTSGKWVGVGNTGADGKTAVQTNGRYDGVAAGTYTVTVIKAGAVQLPPAPKTAEEDKAYSEALQAAKAAKSPIPEKYAKPETSGLTLTVTDKPVTESIELKD